MLDFQLKLINMVSDGTVIIKNTEDYENYLKKYNCKTFNELSELLWFNYGVDVELDKKFKMLFDRRF